MQRTVVYIALAVCTCASMAAAEPVVYPAKGQTAEQQERDQYECHEWATKETGVDPVALAEQQLAAPTPGKQHGGAGAMAGGAGLGAAGGAIESDAAGGGGRRRGGGGRPSRRRAPAPTAGREI